MRLHKILVLGLVTIFFLGTSSVLAGRMDAASHPDSDAAQLVHEAEHEVDEAWELYHKAALGGTLASPALQAEIEQHLHKARMSVAQAQEAAERGDKELLEQLVNHVRTHTAQAIKGSKEQKR